MLKIVCFILYMEWILPMPDFVTSFIDHLANTSALISHASKVMLKILHARLQHYGTKNYQMSRLGLRKEEELGIKLPTSARL